MSTKQLLPNQHDPLHFIYGHNNCCLCNVESKIAALEAQVVELRIKIAEDETDFRCLRTKYYDMQSRLKEAVGDIEATIHNEESDWNAPNFKERRDGRINGLKMALNIFLVAFPELEKKK